MNEQQTKDAFEQGRVQPRCPGCSGGMLRRGKAVKMTEKGTYNYILARAYECVGCGERFVATIGKQTNANTE